VVHALKIVLKVCQMIAFVDWIKYIAISMKDALLQMLKEFVYLGGWLFAKLVNKIAIVEWIRLCVEKTLTVRIHLLKTDYVSIYVHFLEILNVLVEV
jgi:hypothetical protein